MELEELVTYLSIKKFCLSHSLTNQWSKSTKIVGKYGTIPLRLCAMGCWKWFSIGLNHWRMVVESDGMVSWRREVMKLFNRWKYWPECHVSAKDWLKRARAWHAQTGRVTRQSMRREKTKKVKVGHVAARDWLFGFLLSFMFWTQLFHYK